ncbi:MAG: hypothetical protein ACR2QF_15560, partial [Geminicoccaceae bacterium]
RSGRRVWVRHCEVGEKTRGGVIKDYQTGPGINQRRETTMLSPKFLVIKLDDIPFEQAEFEDMDDFRAEAARHLADEPSLMKLDTEAEMFPMKLQDKHSLPALLGYGRSCKGDHPELSAAVLELAERAGKNHPECKEPD